MAPFQSLIGILVNCNSPRDPISTLPVFVSIPNRDFGELQLMITKHLRASLSVSIPNRDFGELQYCWDD